MQNFKAPDKSFWEKSNERREREGKKKLLIVDT